MSVLLVSCAGCKFINYNFTKLTLDPSLHVSTSGTLFSDPVEGDYYFYSKDPKTPSIDHFLKKHGDANRLLFMELDPKMNLVRSVKHDVIMYDKAYGYVYADKLCFYKTDGTALPNSVEVGSFFNRLEEDVPATLPGPPAVMPAMTSISLVRMFHPDPEYIVVSANYEANGEISSLHVDKSKGGVWDSGTDDMVPADRSPDSMKAAGLKPDVLEKYGIPTHIDVAAFLHNKHIDLPPVTIVQGRIVMNLHYGWDKVIQQIEIAHDDATTTTYFQPTVTPEEETLNPLCDAGLAKQQAAGEPTVR